jgi:teichuronic acid exporter
MTVPREPQEDPAAHEADPASLAKLRRGVVRGGTALITTRLITQVFVWAATLLIARFLSPEDYGLMAIGMLLVGMADLLAEAGIGRALIQKGSLEPRDISEGFTLTILLAVVMYAVLAVLADPLAFYVFDMPALPTFLRILGIHILLAPFMAIPLALLDRDLKMGKQSVIHAATAVFQSGLVLLLAILGMGYWSLVAGTLARRLLEVFAYMAVSGWRPRLAPLSFRAQGLVRFGIHVSLATFLWYLYSNADYAFVGRFSGQEILGFYTLAFQLISLPAEKITANINKIAYPTFSRLQNDKPRLHDWFVRLQVLIGFIGIPVMAGMALVAEDGLVVMLGSKWQDAALPLQLLSLAGLFRIYSAMYPMLFNAVGRPDLNFKYSLACAILFPLCFFGGGLWWGMIGVCLVWLIIYPLVVLALIHLTRSVTSVGLKDLFWPQRTIIGGTVFMAVVVVGVQWGLADWTRVGRLTVSIMGGVIAYAVVMLLMARHTVLADLKILWRELKGR